MPYRGQSATCAPRDALWGTKNLVSMNENEKEKAIDINSFYLSVFMWMITLLYSEFHGSTLGYIVLP
jgi:hypothetical protein